MRALTGTCDITKKYVHNYNHIDTQLLNEWNQKKKIEEFLYRDAFVYTDGAAKERKRAQKRPWY